MQCNFLKTNHQRCGAKAMLNSEFCYFHNPAIESKIKTEVQKKGGQANSSKVKIPLPRIKINTSKDVVNLLIQTITDVRGGIIEVRIANCLGVLSGHLIKAFELYDIECRVKRIEDECLNK